MDSDWTSGVRNMFNNMKNQVREKTGREVPKFMPQKGGLSRQSRQGSESSISSLVDIPHSNSQTNLTSPLEPYVKLPDGKLMTAKEVSLLMKKEEELRARLEKKDSEWSKKLERQEAELSQEMSEKKEEWAKREQALTEELLKQTNELKASLGIIEDNRKVISRSIEEREEQIDFQQQELAKIKHLLLAKENESKEISEKLKKSNESIDSLKAEVNRLRPFEEQISNFQDDIEMLRHTSERERWQLSSKLAQSEEEVRHLTDRVAVLTRRSESDIADIPIDDRITALLGERTLLERRLEEAHVHLADIKASWSAQISSLETQVGRLSRQAGEEGSERRRAEARIVELEQRLEEEAKEKEKVTLKVERLTSERDSLATEIKDLTSNIEVARNENVELTDRLEGLESARVEARAECERLDSELSKEKDKTSQIESQLRECEARRGELEAELRTERERREGAEEEGGRHRKEKDDALLRNAQLSQEVDIARHDLVQHQADVEDLYKKLATLEASVQQKDQELSKCKNEIAELLSQVSTLQLESEARQVATETENNLKETIADLESQLSDRNKNIRVLQQRLSDMKKTLQRELKASEPSNTNENTNHHANSSVAQIKNKDEEDVNFLYLKHVIIKFLTSREYEAQHLMKAVATVLKLSVEEEGLLKETLEWRMSWFKSRPKLPNSHLGS